MQRTEQFVYKTWHLLFNFWGTANKLVIPELELRVLDQFNECDKQTPRMRAIDYQPFKQNPRYLLLDGFGVGLRKQVQQSTAEVMSVAVGIA